MVNARDLALIELDGLDLPGWDAHLLKTWEKSPEAPDPRDRALAEQIYAGVLKSLLLLQYWIEALSGRPLKKIDGLVQKILAIGLYQLGFLDRVPASAAVNEAVEQTKRLGRRGAAGFVNAVLRNFGRSGAPPLPDELTEPIEYARIVLSHPGELIERLCARMNSAEMIRFCRHDNAEPPTLVRLYDGADVKQLETAGIVITPHEQAGIFVVEPGPKPVLAEWANRGLAQVQDATAAAVVEHLDLKPGLTVLDRCAGLGTKTLQIQQRIGSANVYAVDPSAHRCEELRKLLARRGIQNVAVVQTPLLSPVSKIMPKTFDRVLVDVPCSNSGVLARRPEARYFQDDDSLRSVEQLQKKILDDTAAIVSPGGILVYSTCSVWKSENEEQVAKFLQRHPEFALEEEGFTMPSLELNPSRYRDGGYFTVIRRHR